ncbi:uncharacterized protein RCC_01581 [Ramularia collo-cygni]|uniref:Large ribosomal subunit protein mL50 n=1 Tax=Ramularia collo-cygni TaxID=112498 RepID=A0A2D3UUQ4_9PEZI|nr:uncharacterized protein RCC_01581 [Ramularia collo-cygni]CZT15747.1 uncharacterized protein RCC_01581 [Ramularia collo-cygni]
MRNARLTGQALSLATETARQPYICRACLAQSTRQLSTSNPRNASSQPFYKRIQDSLFGSKESKAAEERLELAREKQLEAIRQAGPDEQVKNDESQNEGRLKVAAVVHPTTHKNYVVSRTWKGMERIGSEAWVTQRADQGEKYVGFMPPKQVKLEGEDWEALLHNITAEVLTLKKAGRDVLQICNARTFSEEDECSTRGVIVSNKSGAAVVENGKQEKAILDSISETPSAERDPESLRIELAQALASGRGQLFMAFKLNDPRVKFAILKRAMQLTGKRVADISLQHANTLNDLYDAFAAKEAPKKLHETEQLQMLEATPNVQVHNSRRTHVHKDKSIGRWKLVESELQLRNMPTRGESSIASGRDA